MKKEIKKYDLNKFNFYEDENLIRIQREVDVGKHLPQEIIGKGKEFTCIRELENYELSNLWLRFNKVFENFYIQTADEQGIEDYKKLINSEEIKGDLEDQRKIIYPLWNKSTIWTHRTLEDWLDKYIGANKYILNIKYDEYFIYLEINYNNEELEAGSIYNQLRKIIPANLGIRIIINFSSKLTLKTSQHDILYRYLFTGETYAGYYPEQETRGEMIEGQIGLETSTYDTQERSPHSGETNTNGGGNPLW